MYARTQGASAHGLFTVAGERDRHQGRQGVARLGSARQGKARRGKAGEAGEAGRGVARHGPAGISIKRQAVSRSNHRNKWSI